MADSSITKRALATALKELMEEKPFDKISINDICEKCDMNRKSFYYHFRDKYDLVNWIFDTEFIEMVQKKNYTDRQSIMTAMCNFFYDNRSFYRKALSIKGQNSFSEHFRDLLLPTIRNQLQDTLQEELKTEFQVDFFADACVMAFQRWILQYNAMTAEEFYKQLELCARFMGSRYEDEEFIL